MTHRHAALASALLLFMASRTPVHAESGTAVHVVVLGSSTAAGIGPSHPDSGWVERYRSALRTIDADHQVTNLAVGGSTTYNILPTGQSVPEGRPDPDDGHNVSRALELEPDAIVVNMPSNDVASGYSIAEQIANYEVVRLAAAEQGVPVYFTSSQPRDLSDALRDSLLAVRDTTFALYGSRAIDFWSEIAAPDARIRSEYDSGDGVHLNDPAHRILLQRMMAEDIHRLHFVGVGSAASPRLALMPIHPTPARDTALIRFTLNRESEARISLHDANGRHQGMLFHGRRAAGPNAIRLDVRPLAAGVYFCLVDVAGGRPAVARLVVMP